MTEIGPVSYECPQRVATLHIMETEYFCEIVEPDTGRPVGPGQTGELVLTNLGRVGSPLLRYRTGDIVRRGEDACCRCGSWEVALPGGILTRGDDMAIVRGVNVYPGAVEEILRSCGVTEFRVEIYTEGALSEMKVEIEPDSAHASLADRVATALENALGFRVQVSSVANGALPRFEGKSKRWIHRQT
jgi:phenylacetate-CoA ligase